eukprot:TRINITY_DN30917_c0_g4_i1.p1 TRINITY_DN30917_c0_g4~~TRINITY_DN30917_c0_g4_i1.p1  ORF type:complete len:367 (-),score=45.87 TRINITY_DN30917_c0_g4_i1:293-1393(-)
MTSNAFSTSSTAADSNRYIFGITGTVKEIVYPSKAILCFKYNGKEEKAILLVHKFLIDGAAVDEQRLMSDILKVGDVVEFDGHVYDKGGFGQGKDKCNYYAMRAWKASQSKVAAKEHMTSSNKNMRPPTIEGTGYISEVFPRKGVLVFERDGSEERVLFLASKFYVFEKRLGTKQSLDQVLNEGDPVQFEAIPQDSSDNPHYCSWFASCVWKGKKPFDEGLMGSSAPPVGVSGRRGSIGSTGSSESISTEGSGSDSLTNNSLNPSTSKSTISNSAPQDQVIRGRGYIARLLSPSTVLIWWCRQPNHLQSVWYQASQADTAILSNQDLRSVFKEGDAVKFVCSRSTNGGPTQWQATQLFRDEQHHQN